MTTGEIFNVIQQFDHFLVLGHEGPDGDCLGSQLAFASFINRLGKSAQLFSAGPFLKPEIQAWEEHFEHAIPSKASLPDKSLLLLLDCSSLSRCALPVTELQLPLMIIDHHASGEPEGDYRLVDSSSPSTTLLVQETIEASGLKPNREEAEYLFFGFATDTGFFRHLEGDCERAFHCIARLAGYGINPNKVHRELTGGKELASQKMVARAIERAELYFRDKVLITWEYQKDYRDLNLKTRDSGTLYQILQTIGGCEVIILLKEMEEKNKVSVSFRSVTDLNVGEIAQSLGGGGHPKASGCAMEGSIPAVKEQLLELFERYF